jgi:hypothetical protein
MNFYRIENGAIIGGPYNCLQDFETIDATPEQVAQWDTPRLPTPADQIQAIEAANPITHRMLRDLSMTVAQIAGVVTGTDPMVNPAVQQIVALEAQIAVLRAQL